MPTRSMHQRTSPAGARPVAARGTPPFAHVLARARHDRTLIPAAVIAAGTVPVIAL